jgi:type I restriction-modification system DNA methylase subunit
MHFIVQHTVAALIDQKMQQCVAAVRQIKVCDSACGSDAFLIQAYDVLEDRYTQIADNLRIHDEPAADALAKAVPELSAGQPE